jgi:hypothetical protein
MKHSVDRFYMPDHAWSCVEIMMTKEVRASHNVESQRPREALQMVCSPSAHRDLAAGCVAVLEACYGSLP